MPQKISHNRKFPKTATVANSPWGNKNTEAGTTNLSRSRDCKLYFRVCRTAKKILILFVCLQRKKITRATHPGAMSGFRYQKDAHTGLGHRKINNMTNGVENTEVYTPDNDDTCTEECSAGYCSYIYNWDLSYSSTECEASIASQTRRSVATVTISLVLCAKKSLNVLLAF